jgi:LPS-assembly lipoprotein
MMRALAVLMLAFLLGGCGYHLRGSAGVDWHLGKVYLEGRGAVASEVRRLLTLNGVPMVSARDAAESILTITRDSQEREVLSVDPDTGKVREFELTINTGFRVTSAGGEVLLEDDSLGLERDFTFDETAALGKYEEEAALYGEIRKDVAAAIVRRLQPLRLPTTSAN